MEMESKKSEISPNRNIKRRRTTLTKKDSELLMPSWTSRLLRRDPNLFQELCKPEFQNILNQLLSDEKTAAFASLFLTFEDVETTRPELHDFCDAHTINVDICLVQKKLQDNVYKSPDEYYSDMILMFQNSLTFFPSRHAMVSAARKLKTAFLKKYEEFFIHFEKQLEMDKIESSSRGILTISNDPDWRPSSRKNKNQPIKRFPIKRTTKRSATPDPVVDKLNEPNELIKPNRDANEDDTSEDLQDVSEFQNDDTNSLKLMGEIIKPVTPPTRRPVEFTARPMTYTEKAKLLSNIYELQQWNQKKMNGIVDLIRSRELNLKVENWDEFEIDLGVLKASTLRELQVYVTSSLRRKLPSLSLSCKRK